MRPKAHFGTTLNGNDAYNFVAKRDRLREEFWSPLLEMPFIQKDRKMLEKMVAGTDELARNYKPILSSVGGTSR